MAFSFSNAATGGGPGRGQAQNTDGVHVEDGPDLPEIQTDKLGFAAINGEAKLKLLPSPWPKDALPPSTSSLLCIASKKALLAAAGPDVLIIASTKNVREAFQGPQDPDVTKTVKPEIKISVPALSQIAFSADENVLAVSGQKDGGLAAYQVDTVLSGQSEPALQISTNGKGLRSLVPNPATDTAELFAMVTITGELYMADLKSGQLRTGSNGPVLKTGVSCLSWSNRGKQLVAGCVDGTATQMKPDGTVVAEIPKPASIPTNMHVSGISWLENEIFFVIYTPNDTSTDGMIPQSEYYLISRTKTTSDYTFQRLPEVCMPCGMPRMPTFHFIARLRNFKPNLDDLLILASTTSPDIGTITKATSPLSITEPVTGEYTLTVIGDDSRRATIPLGDDTLDTSPIGMGLDLSSTEVIVKPIPSDPEIEQSSTPLPNLLVLNHEGTLCSWWVVHDESVREKVAFPGLAIFNNSSPDPEKTSVREATPIQTTQSPSAGFGQPSFGTPTLPAKPASSMFGIPSTTSGFSAANSTGAEKSSWTNTGFGTTGQNQNSASSFGQPAFGTSSLLGARSSPFGQPPSFGQPSLGTQRSAFGGVTSASPFAAGTGTGMQKLSGFSSFATSSGFGAAKPTGESPFANVSGTNNSSEPAESSPFASKLGSRSDFGSALNSNSDSPFRGSGESFKLQSTFQGDGTAKDDLPKPDKSSGLSFGTAFGDLLGNDKGELSTTHDREAEMGDESARSDSEDSNAMSNSGRTDEPFVTDPQTMVTPPSTINQSKSTPAPPLSALFGPVQSIETTTPKTFDTHKTGFSFGAMPTTTPKEPVPTRANTLETSAQADTTPADIEQSLPSQRQQISNSTDDESTTPTALQPESKDSDAPYIKAEPPSDDEANDLSKIPEAPLPPDPTSKTSYSPGDTSASSINSKTASEDAPLPPDFLPANRSATTDAESAEIPEDADYLSDLEGSGEDVVDDISPTEEKSVDPTEQVPTSPESSFTHSDEKGAEDSPTGGLFTTVSKVDSKSKTPRPLFGELGVGPIFPPPKQQESPRSPSPVRNILSSEYLRPEAARSVSAPSHPQSVIEKRRAEIGKANLINQAARVKEIQAAKEKAEAEAIAKAKLLAEEEAKNLEDDEDERLREELNRPIIPCQDLYDFMPYHPDPFEEFSKKGIPGQIERLYRDINSMVDTLGINARSLSAFMLYQQSQEANQNWPDILSSETPIDALNDEWVLDDTRRLHEGEAVLQSLLDERKISDVTGKLQSCQELLTRDLLQLRAKLFAIRRSLYSRADADYNVTAPLSAEQASIQHDLRKASILVQTKLVAAEQHLAVLRAKLAEVAPSQDDSKEHVRAGLGRTSSQKKPTVEAVTNTIAKMTSMAEKKSADIDVLEFQLKKISISEEALRTSQTMQTPEALSRKEISSGFRTPGSTSGSVYHTPDSRFSTRASSIRNNDSVQREPKSNLASFSLEDRQKWQEKAQRKQEVATVLKQVLTERRRKKLLAKAS